MVGDVAVGDMAVGDIAVGDITIEGTEVDGLLPQPCPLVADLSLIVEAVMVLISRAWR